MSHYLLPSLIPQLIWHSLIPCFIPQFKVSIHSYLFVFPNVLVSDSVFFIASLVFSFIPSLSIVILASVPRPQYRFFFNSFNTAVLWSLVPSPFSFPLALYLNRRLPHSFRTFAPVCLFAHRSGALFPFCFPPLLLLTMLPSLESPIFISCPVSSTFFYWLHSYTFLLSIQSW